MVLLGLRMHDSVDLIFFLFDLSNRSLTILNLTGSIPKELSAMINLTQL
jgi:hypothetical protein